MHNHSKKDIKICGNATAQLCSELNVNNGIRTNSGLPGSKHTTTVAMFATYTSVSSPSSPFAFESPSPLTLQQQECYKTYQSG